VRFESPDLGGVKLVKTYTLKRGAYDIAVRHEVVNTGSAAVAPQLYLQLVRDGNKPPGESSFYSTFTGPAVYTEAKKYQKVEFKTSRRTRPTSRRLSPPTATWPWCSTTFAGLAAGPTASSASCSCARSDNNLYCGGHDHPAGADSRRAPARRWTRACLSGPQEEKVLEALAPGLELVKDYGWLTILAKPLYWLLDKLHSFIWATGAGPSWRWCCCSRSPSTGSTPRPTPAWPR
jgi:YidC/Oxa1 family membrane protein insertase